MGNTKMTKRFEEQLDPADVALLKMAVDQILAAPAWRFHMAFWATENDCGTAFCIGGHMAILDNPKLIKSLYPDREIDEWIRKRRLIGKGGKGGKGWMTLFSPSLWPTNFLSTRITPEIAAKRVEYWLRTGE